MAQLHIRDTSKNCSCYSMHALAAWLEGGY